MRSSKTKFVFMLLVYSVAFGYFVFGDVLDAIFFILVGIFLGGNHDGYYLNKTYVDVRGLRY